mgnify:CR=1 FL=1
MAGNGFMMNLNKGCIEISVIQYLLFLYTYDEP